MRLCRRDYGAMVNYTITATRYEFPPTLVCVHHYEDRLTPTILPTHPLNDHLKPLFRSNTRSINLYDMACTWMWHIPQRDWPTPPFTILSFCSWKGHLLDVVWLPKWLNSQNFRIELQSRERRNGGGAGFTQRQYTRLSGCQLSVALKMSANPIPCATARLSALCWSPLANLLPSCSTLSRP